MFNTLVATLVPSQVRAVFATCPAGKVVTGGGGSSHSVGVSLFDTEPDHINNRERTTWVAQFINDTASNITATLHTYAICVTDN